MSQITPHEGAAGSSADCKRRIGVAKPNKLAAPLMVSLCVLCALVTGCAALRNEGAKVDDTYRKRIESFSVAYVLAPPSVVATWHYRPPIGEFKDAITPQQKKF